MCSDETSPNVSDAIRYRVSSHDTSPNVSPQSSANVIPFEDLDCWSSEKEIESDEVIMDEIESANVTPFEDLDCMKPYIGLEFSSFEEAIQFGDDESNEEDDEEANLEA